MLESAMIAELIYQGINMKKTVYGLLLLKVTLSAGFFETEEELAQKYQAERERYCKFFKQKAIDYKKNMRKDELAYLTLESYKKRAKIYCSSEKKAEVKPKKVEIVEPVTLKKNILLEDERLCKIFKNKITRYQKNIRKDKLAQITLESYRKRAYIFCSTETLEKKEQKIREEDEKLCHLFNQAPKVCILFEKKLIADSNTSVVQTTLNSFKKQAKIFCSDAELEEKDNKVHKEHEKLCHLYHDKMTLYTKLMSKDENYVEHFKLYEKRFNYFCGTSKTTK